MVNNNYLNNYFYKKNHYYLNNKNYSQINKLFLLFIFQILILAGMITLTLLGYNNEYNSVPVQNIPETIASYRTSSIFFMCWYVVIYIFITRTSLKILNPFLKNISIFSIIPIFSIISLIYIGFKNNWFLFKIWFKTLFEPDYELSKIYARNTWRYKMMSVLFVIMLPIVVIVFYQNSDFVVTYPENGIGDQIIYNNLWFCSLQYFTIQTNLLCVLYVLLFIIKPDLKIFKYHTFLISCIVFIFIVGFTYDFALFPIKIANGEIKTWNWYKYFANVYEHLINPVAFTTCGLLLILKDNPNIKHLKYKTNLFYSLIIPTIYLVYATISPFVSNSSVYGFVTNCNPNVYNEIVLGQQNIMSHGQWYFIFIIIGYWFIFFGLLSGLYFLDIKLGQKKEKMNNEKRYY